MKVHFLGTAAAEGIPNVFCRCDTCRKAWQLGGRNRRTRSSVLIDDTIKVDYPPDSYAQAIRDGIDLSRLEHLLFTHTHYDHFAHADLYNRVVGFANGIDHPLNVYGNDSVIAQCRLTTELPEGKERFRLHRLLPFRAFEAGDARITPLLADHDRLETCLLYLIEKNGKTLLYGNDTGWFPDETWHWLEQNGKTIDMAILDCTHGPMGNPRKTNHMCVETIFEVQRRFGETKLIHGGSRLFVTHFTHNAGLQHDEWVALFEPKGIEVAYDGLIVQL